MSFSTRGIPAIGSRANMSRNARKGMMSFSTRIEMSNVLVVRYASRNARKGMMSFSTIHMERDCHVPFSSRNARKGMMSFSTRVSVRS